VEKINDIAKYKNHTKIQVTSLIDNNGKEITDLHKIANTLNTHFSEIGPKLASTIDNSSQTGNFSYTSLIPQKIHHSI